MYLIEMSEGIVPVCMCEWGGGSLGNTRELLDMDEEDGVTNERGGKQEATVWEI